MSNLIELLVSWASLTIAFAAAAWLLPGVKIKGGIGSHLVVAAIFGTLVFLFGRLLYLMIGLGTFGIGFVLAFLTRLVVGTILLGVTDKLTKRLKVNDWKTAFIAALIVSVVASGAEYVFHHVLR